MHALTHLSNLAMAEGRMAIRVVSGMAYATAARGVGRKREGSYQVPSRSRAKRMPAKRRAKATTAMKRPRRAARRSVQAHRATVVGCRTRRMDTAAWTNSERTRGGPALVMRPRRWPSPELHSRGTSPR